MEETKKESNIEMNPVVKAIGNTTSRRLAVNAMCASCMGCNEEHREANFTQMIRECSSPKCPLFNFRPYK